MPEHPPATLQKLLIPLYLAASAVFAVLLAYHSLQLIQYPLPLSYIEAAILTVTDYIASGGNPYAIEAQPARTSVYPVLYNILAVPLAEIFGNTLALHRAFSAVCLLACCALFYAVTARLTGSHSDTVAATALLYCGFMVYSTPVASPNGIGLLLFFAALYLPVLDKFSTRSLVASLLLGVLAFHAKQYFIAATGFMALYLFLAHGKSRGINYGVAALVVFLASLALILPGSPYYLDALVFAVSGVAEFAAANKYMWQQLADYLPVAGPVLAIAAIGATQFLVQASRSKTTHKPRRWFTIGPWKAPLLRHRVSYTWIFFTCSVVIFVFGIGRNPGNHLTYLFQLVSPFLLTLAALAIARAKRLQWPMRMLFVLAFYTHYTLLSHDFSVERQENWRKLEASIAEADSIYATSIVLEQILRQGGEIYNNGHTPYFPAAKNKPAFFRHGNPDETVDALWQNWVGGIHSRIGHRSFDLVVIDTWTGIPDLVHADGSTSKGMQVLMKHYRKRQTLAISLANRPGGGTYAVQIWEPRPIP